MLQSLQIVAARIDHRIKVAIPVPYRQPQNNGSEDGFVEGHIDLPVDTEFSCAVNHCGVVNFVVDRFETALDNDHVVYRVQTRDNIYPESIEKPDILDDEEVRHKPATEEHREDVNPVKKAFKFEVGTTHCIGNDGSEDKPRCRTDYRSGNRNAVAQPQIGVFDNDFVVFKGENTRQEVHSANGIVRTLVKATGNNVDNRIDTAQTKCAHDNEVNNIKGVNVFV